MSYVGCQLGEGIGPIVRNKRVYQRGGGYKLNCQRHSFPNYYYNPQIQTGFGVGGVFSVLGRVLLPLISKGISALKTHGTAAGINLLQQLKDPAKEYITSKASKAIDDLTNKGLEKLQKMKGSGIERRKRIINERAKPVKSIKTKKQKQNNHSKLRLTQIKSILKKKSKCRRQRRKQINCKPNQKEVFQDIFE